jgi:hypothetical protein
MHGPPIPVDLPDHNQFQTPAHLQGYVNKVKADLLRTLRVYNGKHMSVFTLDESETRCPECTDAFTGQVVLSDCATCGGTGYTSGYTHVGVHQIFSQLGPKVKTSTQMGDSEGQRRDTFILVDVPLLQDQDLLVARDTRRVYKIVDQEPQIVAIGGVVVMQVVSAAPLSKPAPEYSVVTW